MKTSFKGKILRYFFVLLIMGFMLIPLFYVLNTSLKTNQSFFKAPTAITTNPTLQSYIKAFSKAKILKYAGNSIMYTLIVTTLNIFMAIFLAFPISRKYLKCAPLIYTLFMIGLFLPDATIPRWRIIYALGLYNTRAGYMLVQLSGGGVPLLMFVSYIKSLPRDLDEAATLDGCGYVQYIFKILIPLMKPAIASMAILSAITVWNEILSSIIYISNDLYSPITRGLYIFKSDYSVQWPELTAALVIVAIPMVILYISLQKYIIDGVMAGGIKA